MEHEQLEEFHELRERVTRRLRRGAYLDRDHVRLCQLLILPSFENPVAWDVGHGRGQDRTTVSLFRSCWRMDVDANAFESPLERLRHPRPFKETVQVSSVVVAMPVVEAMLRPFAEIRVPLAPRKDIIGADGTSLELGIGDFFSGSRIHWWCELPDSWASLAAPIAELQAFFEKTCEGESP